MITMDVLFTDKIKEEEIHPLLKVIADLELMIRTENDLLKN